MWFKAKRITLQIFALLSMSAYAEDPRIVACGLEFNACQLLVGMSVPACGSLLRDCLAPIEAQIYSPMILPDPFVPTYEEEMATTVMSEAAIVATPAPQGVSMPAQDRAPAPSSPSPAISPPPTPSASINPNPDAAGQCPPDQASYSGTGCIRESECRRLPPIGPYGHTWARCNGGTPSAEVAASNNKPCGPARSYCYLSIPFHEPVATELEQACQAAGGRRIVFRQEWRQSHCEGIRIP